jgi:hypothetical protein
MSELGKGEHYESHSDGARDVVFRQADDEPNGSEEPKAFQGSDPDVNLITASPHSAVDHGRKAFE